MDTASRAADYESGEPSDLCNAVYLRKRSAMQSHDDGSVCALSALDDGARFDHENADVEANGE